MPKILRKIAIKFSAVQNTHYLDIIIMHFYSNPVVADTNPIAIWMTLHRFDIGNIA